MFGGGKGSCRGNREEERRARQRCILLSPLCKPRMVVKVTHITQKSQSGKMRTVKLKRCK